MDIIPKKLAIYYGYPSLVNNSSGNLISAVNIFRNYDMLIFGSSLEQLSHPDHNNTEFIIRHSSLANTKVYGYIDSILTTNQIKNRIDLWKSMGIKGIFVDRFGFDYSVYRTKQNLILDYIHSKNLEAFVNAWNIDDVFSNNIHPICNSQGIPSNINSNDWYLAQSYQIINGVHQNVNDWKSKSDKMIYYKQLFGTRMATTTTYDNSQFDQEKMNYAYFSTILFNFDAFSFGEHNFSASNSQLPYRTRKPFLGTKFVSNISEKNGIYTRETNIAIKLDTVNHTIDTLIN